ncbi:2-C-methyl-D-erythritol 4-phosphate cytidylyltransferase [Alteripontixanthobacter maritimus]|uniref:Bifunctional enzyme IspD/IspF n=1 Tax=Alteripontixanthobacter maritimus TaxID=2161824 RepID=A0A369QCH5_9SPHN|nr:bifunctional 2-C-methyl-D-erythritol 4-phosphate cytidylyltransferase/2-C-methyl-D-erythritol 2,4-cyclodiphosphate synthase [Alteripontixanthobacter maritimus]RDC59978.1 2-C-methyl-D-erythritol 4-phosphate cytidylyltransferase [Alteripontixanthobacter maritimus]
MASVTPLPSFAAIVVAAGEGLRAGQPVPKQFAPWRGKPLVRHSVETLKEQGAQPVIVVIPAGTDAIAQDALKGLDGVLFQTGADTRQGSVQRGLQALPDTAERVLIHDAARPILPAEVTARIVRALDNYEGAIPILPVVDSLVVAAGEAMGPPAKREDLRRVQTPQGFRASAIKAAQSAWQGALDAGDDAQVLAAAGGKVMTVEGAEALHKVTVAEDFETATVPMTNMRAIRTGMGYDVHRLMEGEELWLCGIKLDHDRGLAGHSDADVGIHAIVDAILGAIGQGDIGQHFPPSDAQWAGAASDRFLAHAVSLANAAGYDIGNIDLTLICEEPKIGPHRVAMAQRLAQIICCDVQFINVKATTTERLGFTGRAEGIAAQAVATLIAQEKDRP